MHCMQTPTRLRALWHCYEVCAPSGLSEYLEWHLASLAQIHTQIQNNKAARTLEAKASRKTEEPWRKRSSKKKGWKGNRKLKFGLGKISKQINCKTTKLIPLSACCCELWFPVDGLLIPNHPPCQALLWGISDGNQRPNWMGYPVELNEMLWIFQFQKWDK